MFEGKRVVTGEAILSGLPADESEIGRTQAQQNRAEREEAALEALVREYARLVYRIAYAVLRCHHDAEDTTQETFIRVLRYRDKLGRVEDQKSWLARIAWRVATDRSRQSRRKREVDVEDPAIPFAQIATADVPADEAMHGAQISAALEKLIVALPAKLREPLILSTIEEMSPREVAATLEINEAAVRSRIFRARQILKEKMTQQSGKKQTSQRI
jgi:RNA polymerase sigma factor (sigma-70 family)